MSKIPVIINNRNLITWPSKMVEMCKTFEGVGEIIIVDNESTYEPLLDWYDTKPCEIVYTQNYGQSCPWIINLPNKIGCDFYVVTDPDLDLSQTPKDCLLFLKDKMEKYEDYSKIGLSLSNWQVQVNSPYLHHLKSWASTAWDPNSIQDGLLLNQIFDTTFGIYNLNKNPHSGKNCSTNLPYSARHIPWEITNEELNNLKEINYEYFFYLKNATGASSYKNFVSFNSRYENK